MKLFLTSEGLQKNLVADFKKLVGPKKRVKIAFIPTAAHGESGNKDWLEEDKRNLASINASVFEVDLDKISGSELKSELEKADVIWVNGGNTFYLLDRVRKSGFDKMIKPLLKTRIYAGVSAGSIIAGPSIEICATKIIKDENKIGLKVLTGLNLVDFVVLPHVDDTSVTPHPELVPEFEKKAGYSVIPLSNKQAVIYIDGKKKIVE